MRTVEIVTHCWRYSRVLTYQLSSLVLFPPKRVKVVVSLFYCGDCDEDEATCDIGNYFNQVLHRSGRTDVVMKPRALPRQQLLNRSIGRNIVAQSTEADIVWFTDCDYLFRSGCLDSLADIDLDAAPLFRPAQTWFTKDRETGDEYAAKADEPDVINMYGDDYIALMKNPVTWDIDPADFVPHKPGKAIGGIQIVPGDVARKIGYCPDIPKDQRPVADDCYDFKRNFSDTRFRKQIGQKIIGDGKRYRGLPVDIPGVYRIRQTQFGQVDSIPGPPVECRQP